MDCKEIQPAHPKDQSWVFIGRTGAETETPVLWPPDAKSQLLGKDHDAGKIEGRGRRGRQRMRWLDGITDSMDTNLSKLWRWWRAGKPGVLRDPVYGAMTQGLNNGCLRCVLFSVYSGVCWPHGYVYSFPFGFPFHLGYHCAPNIVPCAIWSVLILHIAQS